MPFFWATNVVPQMKAARSRSESLLRVFVCMG